MSYKIWTKEEEEVLIANVNGEFSYKQLVEKFFPDRTAYSLQCRARGNLKLNNLGYLGKGAIKNYHNKDFWKTPNLINSYWAGFSAADGCIRNPSGRNYLFSLVLSSRDYDHLERFKKDISYTSDVKIYDGKSSVSISCGIEWFEDLNNNFNIIPNKTKILEPPNLSEYLEWCYLIGYLDGDGCIHFKETNNNLSISFTSCSKTILQWVADKTQYFIGKRIKKRNVRDYKTFYRFSIEGESAIKLFIFLRNFEVPKLDRKWKNEKIEKYINENYSHLLK